MNLPKLLVLAGILTLLSGDEEGVKPEPEYLDRLWARYEGFLKKYPGIQIRDRPSVILYQRLRAVLKGSRTLVRTALKGVK